MSVPQAPAPPLPKPARNPAAADASPPSPAAWLVRTLGVAWGFAAAIAALLCLSIWTLGDWWLPDLFSHFRLQLSAAFLALAAGLFVIRWRKLAVIYLVAACLLAAPVFGLWWPAAQPAAGPSRLRVMTLNVLYSNREFDRVKRLIEARDPDLVLVVECSKAWLQALQSLEPRYPYTVASPREHGFGIALLSKLPLIDPQVKILTQGFDAPAISCRLEFGGQTWRLIGAHAMSPLEPRRFVVRNRQIESLAKQSSQWLADSSDPVLVLGDFNATPWSAIVRRFAASSGLRDSQRGFGLQASWPTAAWWLRIPIDHIWVSSTVRVHNRQLMDDVGSDHLGVFAELSAAPPSPPPTDP